MENKYYVVDIDCTGNADVVTTLPEDYWFLIAECNDMKTAEEAAMEYEDEIQKEVDKASGNYYNDEDYVPLTQEDYDLDEEED